MKHEPIRTARRHTAEEDEMAAVGLSLTPAFVIAIGIVLIFIFGRAAFALAARALGS